jgi:hypothetical protein
MTRQEKDDHLIQVTALVGLTVYTYAQLSQEGKQGIFTQLTSVLYIHLAEMAQNAHNYT